MGNTDLQQFPKESLNSRIPPSPKLLGSGNMNQSKITGSPKSPKSPDVLSKSDGASSTNSPKSGHSPSSAKSSPGTTKSPLSLAERLVQSTRGKTSPTPRSPVSKSPPTSPSPSTSTITDKSIESSDQCSKSVEAEKNINMEVSVEIPHENAQLVNEKQSVVVENGTSESNEVKPVDSSVVSNQTEIKDNSFESCSSEVKENVNVIISDAVKEATNEAAVNEGSEIKDKPLRIDDSVILELTSKKDIRQKVWEFLEEHSLVVFPKPCFNRIPNFKGCINASQSLEKLEEFKKAKTVQVTPDKAQETARFLTLSWGKRLLVPLLRLKEGLLQNVSLPFAEPSSKMLRSASTQRGLRKWGNKLITLDQNNGDLHIDMIILGSVAVDKKGHRIGIGNGFCDLEFVILSTMNMVTDNTVVVTIVHDAQVFDTLPTNIFKPFDVPIDIIITPNDVIRVENRLDRPKNVFWNYISKRRLLEMPPLQLLRTKQENNSDFDCTLKEVDSEPEEIPPSPKTFKKSKKYHRKRRTFSTRSDTNDSVFKDTVISKPASKQQSSQSKSSDSKTKNKKRAKSTSSQKHNSRSADRNNTPNEQKEIRASSKKPNKRRTKSESAKTVVSAATEPKNSNGIQVESPSSDESPKNKRRPRQKARQQIHSDDINKQSTNQSSNTKYNSNNKQNSRSNSRVTRRDYIDSQDLSREMSTGRKPRREFIPNSKKYYSQNRHNSYSQERIPYGGTRSNSQMQRRDSSRSINMQQNRYSNGPAIHQTRYFNGPTLHHNNYNGPMSSRQNNTNSNHHIMRHNSYNNEPLSHQNGFYDGVITRRNSYSQGSTIRQDGYTNSRIFRPPQYRNRMASQIDERDYVRDSRPRFISNRSGYYNSNDKQNNSRSINNDEFVLKVGNIANNVRVRDLKAALLERGVKPLHITWRGPRGFAYLRYSNSVDVNKDNVIGSLQNVRIKPNGIETAQTQTLIVTDCQFS